jgi:tetratricopeptide (TPR) repeat protein
MRWGRYSLMQRSDGKLSMQRLVQAVARSQMGEDLARQWLELAVDLLGKVYRYDQHDMSTWAACGDLLPHLTAAADLAEQFGCETSNVAFLNNEAGYYTRSRGSFAAARPFHERALAIREKALGPDHPDTAQSLNNLSILAYYEGDYAESARLMRLALAIYEKRLGANQPDTVGSRESLTAIEEKLP